MVKNLSANARDVGLMPGWRGFPGEGNGNPTPVFLHGKNLMDRGTWQGYSPWGHKRVRRNLAIKQQQKDSYKSRKNILKITKMLVSSSFKWHNLVLDSLIDLFL